jgi:hypothetical protein
MATLEAIVGKSQGVYDEGIKVIQDMTGWNKIETGNEEVVCFRRPNDTDFDTFKADLFIDKAPQAVARYCWENWPAINTELQEEDIESFERIKAINDDVCVFRPVTKAKGIVDGRYMTVGGCFLDLGNNTYAMVGSSLDDDSEFEAPAGKVKGELKLSVSLYEPAAGDANRTHL